MQQAQKAATEPQPQSGGILVLIVNAGIIQFQLCQSVFQIVILTAVHRKNRTEHHRYGRFKPFQGLGARLPVIRNRIPDAAVADTFDTCGNKTDFTGIQSLNVLHLRRKNTYLVN